MMFVLERYSQSSYVVLSNILRRNMLASASADQSVKVWDVNTSSCTVTMNDHTDKVESEIL